MEELISKHLTLVLRTSVSYHCAAENAFGRQCVRYDF